MSYGTNGMVLTGQSGSVTLVGCRTEWNTASGIEIDNASDIVICGTTSDRNYISGLYLNGTYMATISGSHFKRNGRNLDANSCHVLFNSASDITFSGCISRHGKDDDGTGNDAPAVWARDNGTSSNISFVGNDLTGVTGTVPMTLTHFWAGALPTKYSFATKLGMLMDERNAGRPLFQNGFAYQDVQAVNLPVGTTISVQFYHDPVPTYSGVTHKLRVTARNESNGSMYSSEFNYLIHREGAAPTITPSAVIGAIGTAGYIAFGSGTLQLTWSSIATDASTYSLSVQNTSSTAIHDATIQIC